MKRAKRESREIWEQRVALWRDSGQTTEEFARTHALNVSTFRSWQSKLSREVKEARAMAVAPSSTGRRSSSRGVEFVELVTATNSEDVSRGFEIVLASGVTVRVPCPFDPDSLASLLSVMECI